MQVSIYLRRISTPVGGPVHVRTRGARLIALVIEGADHHLPRRVIQDEGRNQAHPTLLPQQVSNEAPPEITDRMIVEFAAQGGRFAEDPLPTAP